MTTVATLFAEFLSFGGLVSNGGIPAERTGLFWTRAVSDGVIALSCFYVPFIMMRSRSRRHTLLAVLMAAAVILFGTTHALDLWSLWTPNRGIQVLAMAAMALLSVVAAISLWTITASAQPSDVHTYDNADFARGLARIPRAKYPPFDLENGIPNGFLFRLTRQPDGEIRILHISEGVTKVSGLNPRDVLDSADALLNQIDPEQRGAYAEALNDGERTMSDIAMELRMQIADGTWRWVNFRSHPTLCDGRQIVWNGIATDVTERHLLESEIGRLTQAIEQTPTSMLIVDKNGVPVHANRSFMNDTGNGVQELSEKPLRTLVATELTQAEFEVILDQLADGKPWSGLIQSRYNGRDIRWEQLTASPIRDESGTISHYLFLKQDVSEREEMIRELELSAKVFAGSNEALVICDKYNNIISVNPAFTRITGYTEDEVRGKNPSILKSGGNPGDLYERMWVSLEKYGEWEGEIWNRRKNGTVYPEWLSISIIKDHAGELRNYIAIFNDITGRKEAEEKINYLAHYDPLTGLPNRTLLTDRIKVALGAAQRRKAKLAVMFLDLDRFKNVNDLLGHPIGDSVLKEVARRLKQLLREEDTISRVGGDEFIVIMTCAVAQDAAHVANKILDSIARNFQIEAHDLNIGVSIGISVFPDNGKDFTTLAQAADTALHRAKQLGRNNYQFFNDEMHKKALQMLRIENSLRHAVTRNELLLHYQPQFDIGGENLIGAEALIRWMHPELGLIPPAEFIPIAEESGLILEIGHFVLRSAIRQQAEWLKEGLSIVPVAVNLSPAQFKQASLCETVDAILKEYDLPSHYLELELTESMAMDDITNVKKTIDELNDLGIKLSIDDFGTGYSSLSYLKKLRAHKIKIDQSFVRDLDHDSYDEAIVNAIIGMARNFKFTVIAEGVETVEQLSKLREQGCDQIQGFYFSRPLSIEQFAQRLVLHPPPRKD